VGIRSRYVIKFIIMKRRFSEREQLRIRANDNMAVTFVRTTPFPHCKHCGERMEYYVIGLPDDEHTHPECEGQHRAEESLRVASEVLRGDD